MCLLLSQSAIFAQVKVSWTPENILPLDKVQEEQGVVVRQFSARNIGDYSWQVLRGYTSCGCTTVELEKERIVRPGDSTIVVVRFNPSGKSGPFSETVTIQLTDGEELENATLILEGEVIRSKESILKQFPIEIGNIRASRGVLDFGEVSRGVVTERHLALCNIGDEVREVQFSLPFCQGTLSYIETSGETIQPQYLHMLPGEVIDISFQWDGMKETRWGKTYEHFYIVDSESGKKVEIPLVAVLLPDVSNTTVHAPQLQTERRINLGALSKGQKTRQSLKLNNTGNGILQVLRVYSEVSDVSVTNHFPVSIEPGKSAFIDIDIEISETKDYPIVIITNDAKRPRQTVRMQIE